MLSLDSLKTRTIYSKQEIQSLEVEFKNKLNECYEHQESQTTIHELLMMIKLLYYLADIPSFLREFNQIGDIQVLAKLEILFMKCSHWKGFKEGVQKWVAALMTKIAKFTPTFTIKPQISSTPFSPQSQPSDITFLSLYFQNLSKTKHIPSTTASISFLRVFLIDQLQNKKRQFILTLSQSQQPNYQWKIINESLIKICSDLDNLKFQQICVSICYWLCSQSRGFVKECVLKGAVGFLSQSLGNKGVSEWYGRKILSFLKLLLLGWEGNNQYFVSSDIQTCIAQFTLKHDNPSILQQARALLACMRSGQGKLQKQKQSYEKYTSEKSLKNLQNSIKNTRVLLLYSEDEIVRRQLNEPDNMEYFYKLAKKQENIYLLAEIFNVLAYNNVKKNEDKDGNEGDANVVERIGGILVSSKDKNQLIANSKKALIGLIRMMKQLAQSRQYNEKLIAKFKSEGIVKKLSKFSDCTNFRFERELLSFIRVLGTPSPSSVQSQQKTGHDPQSNDLLKTLLKHMNETAKRSGKRLEDELEQLELIYQMLHKGQTAKLSQQVIEGIFKKLKAKKTQTEQVQISILDRSQQQRNRQIIERINYLAICCLDILRAQGQKQKQKNKDNSNGNDNIKNKQICSNYQLKKEDMQKLINIGLTTQAIQTLKIDTSYLISLSQTDVVEQEIKDKIAGVYRRYKELLGEDCQLSFNDKVGNDKKEINEENRVKKIQEFIQKSLKTDLDVEGQKQLEESLLNEEDIKLLERLMSKYGDLKQPIPETSLLIMLKFLLKLSMLQQLKKPIFTNFSQFLQSLLPTPIPSTHINLTFKILSQLYQQNITTNTHYFDICLIESYQHFSKQSIQFTNTCLFNLQYKGTNTRKQQYWRYIYNIPEMIGREAVWVMSDGADVRNQDKFWSFFGKDIGRFVDEEKKLSLHFMEVVGDKISKDAWDKFQLHKLMQKITQILKSRNQQLQSKISQPLLRKLLRLSKPIYSILCNENLKLQHQIPTLYTQIIAYITSFSNLRWNKKIEPQSDKLKMLIQQYTKVLMQILKRIFRRRQGYAVVRMQLAKFQQTCAAVANAANKECNDVILESFRVMFLRDDQHQQFQGIHKMWEYNKNKITASMTQKGTQHFEACQRIIDSVLKKNEPKFKKQYLLYFFPQKSASLEALSFSDQQLLKNMKNLLNPPYNYGINLLQRHFRLVQSSQFANTVVQVFVRSPQLYQEQKEHQCKSLEEVQQSLADSIWGPGCQVGPEFYQMINMNLRGLRVCLKMKGIGVQGTTIVCEKFFQYPEQIPLCSEILHLNVQTLKQWNIVLQKKIPDLINNTFPKSRLHPTHSIPLCNLIGSSSKLKQIQIRYKIHDQILLNLIYYSNSQTKNIECIASTLYAISGLVYLNEENQRILGNQDCIKKYIKIILDNADQAIVLEKGCNLLSNLVYKNAGLAGVYVTVGVDVGVVKVASGLLYQYGPYKQFLRLIGNLSLSGQAASSITKTQFLNLWSNILQQSQTQKHEDITKYSFDIIFNLLNHPQLQSKPIAYKISESGIPKKIILYLSRNNISSLPTQSGLETLQKCFMLENVRKDGVKDGVLICLEDIAKVQAWNQGIMEKWVRVVLVLMRDQETIKGELMRCEVFGRLALVLKQGQELKQEVLNNIVTIVDIGFKKGDKLYFNACGLIDLMCQLLKLKPLKSITASTIIDYFNTLHTQKILPGSSYNKIFSSLISRLQLQFRDENSKKIIETISRIRDYITINTHAATILLQFSYIFLTQKQIITSSKYHKRVREYICLLSYFISFNMELKIIFREDGFIKILDCWMLVDRSLDEEYTVAEACQVCLFAIWNQQRLVGNLGEWANSRQEVYQKLITGTKCLLYRRDHSNKPAILKLRQSPTSNSLQLISYKQPDGQIKQKYIIPLKSLIGYHSFSSSQDPMLALSVFISPKNIFQKNAIPQHCLTLIGIVNRGEEEQGKDVRSGENIHIRRIDVQFQGVAGRAEFVEWVKVMATIQFKSQGRLF